jgi:hypothetical protein
LVCKHWGCDLEYVIERMPVSEWWPALVTALEQEEIEQRRNYWGKVEDYVPLFAPDEITMAELQMPYEARQQHEITRQVLTLARQLGAGSLQGNLETVSQMRPDLAEKVYLNADGEVVNEHGQPVSVPEGTAVVDPTGKTIHEAYPRREGGPISLEDVFAAFGLEPPPQS